MLQNFLISTAWLFLFIIAAGGQPTADSLRGGILNGGAVNLIKPEYPAEAKDFCAGGKVEVEVLISEKGDVLEAGAISGDTLLYETSVRAVKKTKFWTTPHLIAQLKGIIVYNFDPFAPKCITVGVVNKRAISLPPPQVGQIIHPKHLRLAKEEIVAVQIIVDFSGNVTAARVLSGHPLLRGACGAAARRTKFSPTNVTGTPVKVRALLVYKIQPDGSVETDVESDDKTIIGTPINLVEPSPPFCNCNLGGSVSVEAVTDLQGNITQAIAFSGHPLLKNPSARAALESKFLPTDRKAKIILIYHYETIGKYDVKIKNIEIKKVEIEK